jgi:hypothetical protein
MVLEIVSLSWLGYVLGHYAAASVAGDCPFGDVQFTVRILQNVHEECVHSSNLAPAVGFEPTTNRLTADRSTTELRWIFFISPLAGRIFCLHCVRGQGSVLSQFSSQINCWKDKRPASISQLHVHRSVQNYE